MSDPMLFSAPPITEPGRLEDEAIAPPDFVVVDVETACSRVSSICQIGVVGFRDGTEVLAYETLVDPCDDFSSFNTRIHGISSDHVISKPTFAQIHAVIDRHLAGRITVAHSLFDKGALASACRVHDRQPIETTWLDSAPGFYERSAALLAKAVDLRQLEAERSAVERSEPAPKRSAGSLPRWRGLHRGA
ncbi:exonuclease domain-containing protein [Flavisphingomonas formosensis]|uniref:exonuclease domain-containing protein n=1 Tax=Flavisphingomonas formosensis TaxID=861534 RepID=UPI001E2A88E9|nr:exonuclease domain-containing protein [Sphingomonas formosensis]